jgi:hypothetical protein
MKDFNAHREAARASHKAKLKYYDTGGGVTAGQEFGKLLSELQGVNPNLGTMPGGSINTTDSSGNQIGGVTPGFAYGQKSMLSSPSDMGNAGINVLGSPTDLGPNPTPPGGTPQAAPSTPSPSTTPVDGRYDTPFIGANTKRGGRIKGHKR